MQSPPMQAKLRALQRCCPHGSPTSLNPQDSLGKLPLVLVTTQPLPCAQQHEGKERSGFSLQKPYSRCSPSSPACSSPRVPAGVSPLSRGSGDRGPPPHGAQRPLDATVAQRLLAAQRPQPRCATAALLSFRLRQLGRWYREVLQNFISGVGRVSPT